MIIPRAEFYLRCSDRDFDVKEEREEDVDVEMLYEEAKKDAPFRNHQYMFDGTDITVLPIQEETCGIKNKYPDIKTEGDRWEKVFYEIVEGTYAPVPIFRDYEHPALIYIDDGFHRIDAARDWGLKTIKCKVKIGRFRLRNSIKVKDTIPLLEMMQQVLGDNDLKEYIEKLKKIVAKNPEGIKDWQLCYGGRRHED